MAENIRMCYRVSLNGGEPENFYEGIKGFEYQWGYNYEISVQRKSVAKPLLADASSYTYELKKVVRKEKVFQDVFFEVSLMIDGTSLVVNRDNTCWLLDEVTIEPGTHSCSELAEAKSGVFRHRGDNKLELISLTK
jgi:hypothetical protein